MMEVNEKISGYEAGQRMLPFIGFGMGVGVGVGCGVGIGFGTGGSGTLGRLT